MSVDYNIVLWNILRARRWNLGEGVVDEIQDVNFLKPNLNFVPQ